jgi:hypothetical protein
MSCLMRTTAGVDSFVVLGTSQLRAERISIRSKRSIVGWLKRELCATRGEKGYSSFLSSCYSKEIALPPSINFPTPELFIKYTASHNPNPLLLHSILSIYKRQSS